MKRFIFVLLAASSMLSAKKLTLTHAQLDMIKKSPNNSQIAKRFISYTQMRDKIIDYSIDKKLAHVNTFFNKINSEKDNRTDNGDSWATRKEFLIRGKGDCEDYSIAKYFSLIELGVDKKCLYFAVVQISGRRALHMNLIYVETPGSVPLVLDNLNLKILPLNESIKLEPIFAFNEFANRKLSNNGLEGMTVIDWGKKNRWKELLTRVYKYNE